MPSHSDTRCRCRADHRQPPTGRRATSYTNSAPLYPSDNCSQTSNYHNDCLSSTVSPADGHYIKATCDDKWCNECRKQHRRYQDASSSPGSSGVSGSDIIAIVTALVGFGLTGGLGSIGIQFAAATLRAATMTAYAGATGAAAVGTGYVAIKGGRLVIQQAKPGIIMTVRAANRVIRDCRTGALVAGQVVADAVETAQSAAASQAEALGNVVTQVPHQVLSGSEAFMARLFNLPSHFTNVLLRSMVPGQQSLIVSVLTEADAQSHLQSGGDPGVETFAVQELEDGTIGIQRIIRNGDLGDASWTTSAGHQFRRAQSPNMQSPNNQSPENMVPDNHSLNSQALWDHSEDEDGFIRILAPINVVLSQDDMSTTERLSFETAQETAAASINDVESDYEIV